MTSAKQKSYDLVIIGGGILGVSLAYWLSTLYRSQKIALLEKEAEVGLHTSSRNTGVLHRPFYLDPVKKKIFARSALLSCPLWHAFAKAKNLPWVEVGTVEVATDEDQFETVKKYARWALKNGMKPKEVQVLDKNQLARLEPNLKAVGAIFCPTDVATDFGLLTKELKKEAQKNGLLFFTGTEVVGIKAENKKIVLKTRSGQEITAKYAINCAGGQAVQIAHLLGVARRFADINFRGEYWLVDPAFKHLARHNIYSVPRHSEFPFLDPHWIVCFDGHIEIGPTAVPVDGPYTYKGFFKNPVSLCRKLLEKPLESKLKLLVNPEFLRLACQEWRSSLSKTVMLNRIKRFLPKLEVSHLTRPGAAGIRSQVIDESGHFVKEALEFTTPNSFHILNFNSPGATGAPAYTAYLVNKLKKDGQLDHLQEKKAKKKQIWDFAEVVYSFLSTLG
jgi:L-2-hydroxyglutarate oxidase